MWPGSTSYRWRKPLANIGGTKQEGRERSGGQRDILPAQPHRAAEALDGLLLGQFRDHRILLAGSELRRVGAEHACHVPGIFDDRDLEAKADAEEGNLLLTNPLDAGDLALDATLAEATWNDHGVQLVGASSPATFSVVKFETSIHRTSGVMDRCVQACSMALSIEA